MRLIITLAFLILISCNGSTPKVDNLLRECINESINRELSYEYVLNSKIDFFKLISEAEIILFNNQNLDSFSKSEYIKRVYELLSISDIENAKLQNHLNTLFEKSQYDRLVLGATMSVYNYCPIKMPEIENNVTLILQFEMINKIFESNFGSSESSEIFIDWIQKISDKDLNNIVYRASIILALTQHLAGKIEYYSLEN
jgi:hypothetical protein